MKNSSFQATLFRPLCACLVGSAVLLAAVLSVFHATEIERLFEERGQGASRQLASMARLALARDTMPAEASLELMLDESAVRSVSLYRADQSLIAHAGPQPLADGKNLIFSAEAHIISARYTTSFITPINEPGTADLLAWAVVEMSRDRLWIIVYRSTLGATGLTLLFCVLAAGAATLISRRVFTPLDKIDAALQQCAAGDLNVDLQSDEGGLFSQLVESIQVATSKLRDSQRAMQEHIDQATRDLRETLETVEVQNVELSIARKEALEASRAKSEFLANTSHEIRTPINGIIGFTGLLLKTQVNEQQKEYLRTIQKSSQGLLTTINAILDVSKIETGQLVLDYNPLQLRDMVEEPLAILSPAAQVKNLQLYSIIDDSAPHYLLGDSLRLKQIITNLVSNAIKFSDNGDIVVRVNCINAGGNNATLKFTVEDSGIGISQAQKPQLFKAFSQGDSSHARSEGGTGLGLAVCKGLVKQMGGEIGVDSELGRGTTFWFTAKLNIDRSAAPQRFEALQGKRIVLCSAEELSVQQLNNYLASWRCDVHQVTSKNDLRQFLNTSSGKDIDAVIWDISTARDPRAWARQSALFQEISRSKQCAVVFITQPGCDLDYEQSENENCGTYVSRPVGYSNLYEALCRKLDELEPREHNTSYNNTWIDQNRPPRIMAVDDNAANLQLIGELLGDLGAEVTLAKSGTEALACFEDHAFDLIFMDIQMPHLDGLETTRHMRAMENGPRRTPVVALTAHAMTEQKAELLLAGLDDYLSKPVSEAQLAHTIRRWVQNSDASANDSVDDEVEAITAPDSLTIGSPITDSPVNLKLSLRLSAQKPELARDMLHMLLNDLPEDLRQIKRYFATQDFDSLEAIVHKLHGGASYCGVPRLKTAAAAADRLLQQKVYDSLDGTLEELVDALEELLSWQEGHDLDALFDLEEVGPTKAGLEKITVEDNDLEGTST